MTPATASAEDERPEVAEPLLEPGREEVAPDVGVGDVVGDRVGIAALQLLGLVERPDVDARERVAGDDQVAHVPEAAAGDQSRRARRRRRRLRVARRAAITITPTVSASTGRHHRQLRAERQPGGQPRDEQGAGGVGRLAACFTAAQPARVDQDGDRARGRARSRRRRCWRCPAGARTAGRPTSARRPRRAVAGAGAVGAADAPAGEQRQAEPGEVEQRREEVVAEQQEPVARGAAPRPAGRTSSGRAGR